MKKVTIAVEIEVPDWVTHVAIEEDGTPRMMSDTIHGVKGEIVESKFGACDGVWEAPMEHDAKILNWDKTLTPTSND